MRLRAREMRTRTIETLDKDLKTVNVWRVPENISLHKVCEKQDSALFVAAYFVSLHPRKQ